MGRKDHSCWPGYYKTNHDQLLFMVMKLPLADKRGFLQLLDSRNKMLCALLQNFKKSPFVP